jgi:hypothetical protein
LLPVHGQKADSGLGTGTVSIDISHRDGIETECVSGDSTGEGLDEQTIFAGV